MYRTHYAINFSDACMANGDGICDGEVPEGEGNFNAVSDDCTCPCHRSDEVFDTVASVKAWHDDFHMVTACGPNSGCERATGGIIHSQECYDSIMEDAYV